MEVETPATPPGKPATGPQEAIKRLLVEMISMLERGDLQSLVVGFVKTDGGAAIQSTPMSPVMMNHLSTLLERRVAREYDRALAQANSARAGTGAGAVPETSRKVPPVKLPRNVRREISKAQNREHVKNRRKIEKAEAAQALIANTKAV